MLLSAFRSLRSVAFFLLLCAPALADFAAGVRAIKNGDYATAYKEFLPLATRGDALAQYNLGVFFDNGQGVPQDYKKAMHWYRLAADQSAGHEGIADAQTNLGMMYQAGRGVPKDSKEAVRWYRLAADQGNARAQFNLGLMYSKGDGVTQDYKMAAQWVSLAANQGTPEAQELLGSMYFVGQGVPQDYVLAHMWCNLAAASGHDAIRDEIAKKMTPLQVAEAQRLAREWKPKASR